MIKKRKTQNISSDYIDIGSIVPTSTYMQGFFSTADYALDDSRKSISPVYFEMQMVLKMIRLFRDQSLITEIHA